MNENTEITHEIINPFHWADYRGGTKLQGVRIQRGQGFVFIPDSELMTLATTLADLIEQRNNA